MAEYKLQQTLVRLTDADNIGIVSQARRHHIQAPCTLGHNRNSTRIRWFLSFGGDGTIVLIVIKSTGLIVWYPSQHGLLCTFSQRRVDLFCGLICSKGKLKYAACDGDCLTGGA